MADEDSKGGDSTIAKMAAIKRKRLDELTDSDDILDWVAAFTGDYEFVGAIEEFTDENAPKFEGMEEGAFTLEHTELYNQFLALAEGKIESFLETKGIEVTEFYRRCREAVEASEKEGSAAGSKAFFVQLLLGCSEFTAFATMMSEAAKSSERARESLLQTATHLLDFLEDGTNTSKVEEDDLDDAKQAVTDAIKWVKENPTARMGESLLMGFELEATLHPILLKYMGEAGVTGVAALFRM